MAPTPKRFDRNPINFVQYLKYFSDDEFSFEDFITSKFSARSFNGSWWSNNELQWSDVVRITKKTHLTFYPCLLILIKYP